ncbi:MAG TPA: sulfite exporter TauE/SafE family protein [Bryobacteraceae bacterium]|nr:sulfite exporter TauE/SafE family protein [Bryobacteraceae bacterium]
MNAEFLARLLHQPTLSTGWVLLGILVACGLGALHAMSPGHGKTIVAAYLVGSRGTMKHAIFLGAVVTFTHTFSVFMLGIGTLLLSSYVVPDKIIPWLGAISGCSIVAIGASLLYKRLMALQAGHPHTHHHAHDHEHGHAHTHEHAPSHELGHSHEHDHGHSHEHPHSHGDDHTHSHVPSGEVTLASLLALGVSGGLVPCPTAMVLLLSAIALGRVGLGLVLLSAFSIGLAGVLMAIGMMVLYAKSWLPDPAKTSKHPLFRLVPVLSAFVIVCVGLVMTGVSLGWIKPGGFAG